MEPTYTEMTNEITGSDYILADYGDGKYLSIPKDLANSDYQTYLASLDEPTKS